MESVDTTIKPTENTTLIKTGRPSLKLFTISVILIPFIFIGIATFTIAYKKSHTHDLSFTEYIDSDTGSQCTDSLTECNGHGQCITDTSCLCDSGYTTYDSDDGTYCNYKQKSQLTAFLLSFFLGSFAAGRFYVEDYAIGAAKICVVCLAPYIGCCVMALAQMMHSKVLSAFGYVLLCTSGCSLTVWCVVDIVLFGTNSIDDGNGVALAAW